MPDPSWPPPPPGWQLWVNDDQPAASGWSSQPTQGSGPAAPSDLNSAPTQLNYSRGGSHGTMGQPDDGGRQYNDPGTSKLSGSSIGQHRASHGTTNMGTSSAADQDPLNPRTTNLGSPRVALDPNTSKLGADSSGPDYPGSAGTPAAGDSAWPGSSPASPHTPDSFYSSPSTPSSPYASPADPNTPSDPFASPGDPYYASPNTPDSRYASPGSPVAPASPYANPGTPASPYASPSTPASPYASPSTPGHPYADPGAPSTPYPGPPSRGTPGSPYGSPASPGAPYPSPDASYPSAPHPSQGSPYSPGGPYGGGGSPYSPYGGPASPYRPYAQQPPRTSGFAVASLVLGILGIFAITAILSVIFGFVGLAKIRRTGQNGKGIAIAGIALSAAWVIVLIALGVAGANQAQRSPSGQINQGGSLSVLSLKSGDCFVYPSDQQDINTITAIPCSQAHDAQVFAQFNLSGSSSNYPTNMTQLASDGCQARTASLNKALLTKSMTMKIVYPQNASWVTGNRTVNCVMFSPTNLSTSLLNS